MEVENRHRKKMDKIKKEKETRRNSDQETLSPGEFVDLLGSPPDMHRAWDELKPVYKTLKERVSPVSTNLEDMGQPNRRYLRPEWSVTLSLQCYNGRLNFCSQPFTPFLPLPGGLAEHWNRWGVVAHLTDLKLGHMTCFGQLNVDANDSGSSKLKS